jgi:protein SCO1/2
MRNPFVWRLTGLRRWLVFAVLAPFLGAGVCAFAHEGHDHARPEQRQAVPEARSPWGSGYFPNVPLVTQDGKTVRFYDDLMKGKKVLVNFIFSSCDRACPLDTANMARVQKLLGERVGREIFMYSITLDPEHDTPEVLKAYAGKFGAGPGWLFLTGRREDIDKVRFKLGDRGAKEEHANTVRVGDVTKGQWIRVPLTADPHYIVTEVRNTFDPGWSAGKRLKSIAEAPRPEVFGPGQVLFYNRCAACHTFGKGDLLGPDLKGVTTRRERAWLVRFLAAPDQMRAGKDPVALELAKQYKVVMPNLSLTNKELGDLIEYLEAKSGPPPVSEAAQAMAGAPAAADGAGPDAHAHHDHHHHSGEAK